MLSRCGAAAFEGVVMSRWRCRSVAPGCGAAASGLYPDTKSLVNGDYPVPGSSVQERNEYIGNQVMLYALKRAYMWGTPPIPG